MSSHLIFATISILIAIFQNLNKSEITNITMAYSTPFKKWDRRRSRQNESPTPESSDKKMKVVDEDELFYDTGSEMSDLKIGDLSEDELLMEAYNTFSNSNNNIPANRLKKGNS